MAIQTGDVIRLRLVATVTAMSAQGVRVLSFGGTQVDFPRSIIDDQGFEYEKVPALEPAYTAGELYRDADGNVYLRTGMTGWGDRWRVVIHSSGRVGQYVAEDTPARPLTRLVPESQAPPAAPADPVVDPGPVTP